MKTKSFLLFFLMAVLGSYAQEINSKADKYFYSYAYKEAIESYKKDMGKGILMTNYQSLNLADSYFQTGDFENASKIYLDINKKDTIMSNHQFNKMLQSLSKTSKKETIKAFLSSKSYALSKELLENVDFNLELLKANLGNSQNFQIFNSSANTPQADFSPTFYKEKLLFTSGRIQKAKNIYAPSGESYLDIYVAKVARDGNLLNPNPFTGVPDFKFHKATPYYSQGLDKIFYILSNANGSQLTFDDNGKNALAIGMVDSNGLFNYLLRDLSTSFYYPFFDETSGKLYFAANFKDKGYGGTDIYYVYVNNGQIMSQPVNLGPRINTPANEISPYVLKGNMYFSSDVFYGIGGMDIYKTILQPDGFSIPVNLGVGINSIDDDFGFIVKESQDGIVGYFSSNREGGKGNDDIYGFATSEGLGLKTFIIKGKVVDLSSNEGIDKAQVKLIDQEGNMIKDFYTDINGNYKIEIPWQDNIAIQATKNRHSIFSVNYGGPELDAIQNSIFNMGIVSLDDSIKEEEGKSVVKLNKFYFEKRSTKITSEIAGQLDKVIDLIQRFPGIQLEIESHTDSRGSNSSNKLTSQKRADAIKLYLLKNGASSSNIVSATGYGEEQIINSCTNGVYCIEFLHKKNLRNLFVILNADSLN